MSLIAGGVGLQFTAVAETFQNMRFSALQLVTMRCSMMNTSVTDDNTKGLMGAMYTCNSSDSAHPQNADALYSYVVSQLGTFQNKSTLLIVFCRLLELIIFCRLQECKDLMPKRIHSTLHYFVLIVSVDYYEVLTKVMVKQIMIVDTYRTTRNDSWNIDCMILDDVSTFHIHQHTLSCNIAMCFGVSILQN
jgi:IS1 family transposase